MIAPKIKFAFIGFLALALSLWLYQIDISQPLLALKLDFLSPGLAKKLQAFNPEYLRATLSLLPLRVYACWCLYIYILRQPVVRKSALPNLNLSALIPLALFINALYCIDLTLHILSISRFASFSELGPFAKMMLGHWPGNYCLIVVGIFPVIPFFISLTSNPSSSHILIHLLSLLTLEGLQYSFGYTENTFSSWKVMLCAFAIIHPISLSQLRLFASIPYLLAGMEKMNGMLSSLLSRLSPSNDSIRVLENSVFDPSFSPIVLSMLMAVQLMGIFFFNSPTFFTIWALGMISFHFFTIQHGIGSIFSPWIVTLLLILLPTLKEIGLVRKLRNTLR